MTAPLAPGIGPNSFNSGAAAMEQIARDLHRMSDGQKRALRKRIRTIGAPMLADARRRAGWSTRIPAAISVRPLAGDSRGRVGLQLRVSARKAPHARPYEGITDQGNEGYFRHPVFGNYDAWVSQRTRQFAHPAVIAQMDNAREAVVAAFEDAARDAGFR